MVGTVKHGAVPKNLGCIIKDSNNFQTSFNVNKINFNVYEILPK